MTHFSLVPSLLLRWNGFFWCIFSLWDIRIRQDQNTASNLWIKDIKIHGTSRCHWEVSWSSCSKWWVCINISSTSRGRKWLHYSSKKHGKTILFGWIVRKGMSDSERTLAFSIVCMTTLVKILHSYNQSGSRLSWFAATVFCLMVSVVPKRKRKQICTISEEKE